jgi:hypothetical protein
MENEQIQKEINNSKESKTSKPDYKGFLEVAGWIKENSNGVKFITLKISQYCDIFETAVK